MQDVSCPDSKRLTAYFQHNLPENDALCLTEHLRQCAACRTRIALMSSVPGEVVLPQRAEGETSLPQLATDITGPSAGELSVLSVWGEYRLLEKLGEGGMGTVYKSLHTRLDKTVAVKMLTKRFRGDAQLVGRFEREMKAAGRVNHPNVVQAYDAREIDGTCFLVTEYVDGLNLEQVVGRHGPLRQVLPGHARPRRGAGPRPL